MGKMHERTSEGLEI